MLSLLGFPFSSLAVIPEPGKDVTSRRTFFLQLRFTITDNCSVWRVSEGALGKGFMVG